MSTKEAIDTGKVDSVKLSFLILKSCLFPQSFLTGFSVTSSGTRKCICGWPENEQSSNLIHSRSRLRLPSANDGTQRHTARGTLTAYAFGKHTADLRMYFLTILDTLQNTFSSIYKAKHGPKLYESYLKAQHDRRCRACAKRKVKEPYDSSDARNVASLRLIDGGCQGISE
ncbi:hypothetical protein B0H14DRAFT_2648500 [Mycena olivaceomarginata]|nr:hypothetical protein B0H14DRAFT_2648500 [Mycena olivaceomarginata]